MNRLLVPPRLAQCREAQRKTADNEKEHRSESRVNALARGVLVLCRDTP